MTAFKPVLEVLLMVKQTEHLKNRGIRGEPPPVPVFNKDGIRNR